MTLLLFKPDQLSPDSSAFDSTQSKIFSWRVLGEPQTHYQLKIYNNTTNAVTYDSSKLASSIMQHTLPSSSLTNGVDYKWQVQIFNGSNSVLSDFVFIKTYNNPTITMTVPATISTRSFTFTGNYSQTQNVPYQKYKFVLYDNLNNVILDSGFQYGFNLSYLFEGFESAKSYSIELITESQYELTGTTGKISFNVSYTQPGPASYLVTTPNNNSGGILLNWSPLVQVTGTSVGTISYTTGKFGQGVQIDSASKVTFSKEVPIDFTINLWVKLPTGFSGDIVTLGNDEVKVGYNGSQYYLVADGNTALGRVLSLPSNFFKLALKSDKVIIETSTYTELL